MEVTEIISQLKDKFGDKIDVAKITNMLGNFDHSKMDFTEIVDKIKGFGLLGDLDGDGKVESPLEELKGKAASMFGDFFGKH